MSAGTVRMGTAEGRWVLAVAVLGSGIAFLEATVVNVALPTIADDLGARVSELQWVLNGYLLTLAALILIGGALGDRFGRRRVFEVGIVWFTLSSALCALAPSPEALIAARVLQGVGGALLTPGSLAIIEATFVKEDRAKAIGAWSGLVGVSGAIGPLVGGYLVDAVTWRAIFFINLPLGAFVLWQARRRVPESRDEGAEGALDFPGAALAAFGLAGVTYALIEGPEQGIGSPAVVAGAVLGAAALAAFIRTERRSESPMLPLGIFSSRQFTSANLLTFVVYGSLGGVLFLMIAFLQVALGYSPIGAGAAELPITVLMLGLSARAGALATRIGPRIPLTVGPLLIAGGMLLMRGIDPGDAYISSVLPSVVVFGLGLSLTVAPITATTLAAADPRHAGIASGVNNAVARSAQLVAVALLPALVGLSGAEFNDAEAMADGFHAAMAITAGVAVAGAVLAWFTIREDVLESADDPGRDRCREALDQVPERHCAVAGTPVHSTGLGSSRELV